MGQCPSTPAYQFGDGSSTETNSKARPGLCHVALPLQHILPAAQSPSTFLKLHQPDRIGKCILDPSEVRRSLSFQADEMLAREGLGIPESSDEDLRSGNSVLSDDGDSSRVPDFMSVAASEMSTWSAATRPAGNLGRPVKSKRRQSNQKFSVMDNLGGVPKAATLDSCEDEDDEIAFYTQNKQKSPRVGASLSLLESMVVASSNLRKLHKERIQKTKQDQNLFFDVYENLVSPWAAPKDEVLQRREQYVSALHLKMKAHLGYYYTQRYLPLFPDAPAPVGISPSNIKERAPNLVADDSSSSSSSANSQSIDYGAIPPATQVKSSISDLPFMDLAITGSLGLVARHGHTTARRMSSPRRNQKSPDHYIVLMNRRSGVPLAVCALKSMKGDPVVRMFATKARVPGQQAAATTKQLGLDWAGNFPLYAWAEIVTDGIYPKPVEFSIFMALGSEGRFSSIPCYKAGLDASDGKPAIKVVGRTDKEVRARGCALIDIEVDEKSSKDEDLVFKMKISQGIDPALMICFTAVADEVIEKSMRLQARFGVPRRRD
jgi:hypothetical protein